MSHQKKSQLLGMSFMTAKHRLDRDLLFMLAVKLGHTCFRCQKPLIRNDFSVDHKNSWMSADDPKVAFFDVENCAFSHQHCNTMEMIDRRRKPIEHHRKYDRDYKRKKYTTEVRRL